MKTSVIDDVAAKAGVSPSTVSRVFNNRPYVKSEIRQRVFQTAAALNYLPKSVVRKEIVSVVVQMEQLSINSYETAIISQLAVEAMQRDVLLEIVPLQDLERVYRNFSQAVIAMVYDHDFEARLSRLENVPVLAINHVTDAFCCIASDHRDSAYRATSHLLEHGKRRIAALFAPFADNMSWGTQARLEGYRAALSGHGVPFQPSLVSYGVRLKPSVVESLIRIECPDALYICDESLVLPVKGVLDRMGVRVPEELSVLSYYAPGVSPHLYPEPTCMRQDFTRMAQVAMDTIFDLKNKPLKGARIMLTDELVMGRSVS